MFSYRKIVFGIKHRYQIGDVLYIFKQQRFCSVLISEHNVSDLDYCCNRSGVHYHGLIESINCEGNKGNVFMQLYAYCIFINEDHCSKPVEYMAHQILPPKEMILQEILKSSNLSEYLKQASSMQQKVIERKLGKKMSIMERNDDVVKLVDLILKFGCNNSNLMSRLKKEFLWATLQTKDYKHIAENALNTSKKIVLNSSILDLSNRSERSDEYLTLEESVSYVKNWCSFQKLDPQEFTKNLIRCLDKKSGNRCSIYFQGSSNSGKTYIVESIMDACIHVGQVMLESTAYPFVWENCVDKRLIVMREPHFSLENVDQLEKILSGSGTLIYKHNNMADYLQPTPVIIVANECEWTDNPELSSKIKKRLVCCYMNLKTFPVCNVKKLHPRWLNSLNTTFTSKYRRSAELQQLRNSCERPLQSNPNPDVNKGLELMAEKRRSCNDINVTSHESKANGESELLANQAPMNRNQNPESTMDPHLKYRKHPNGNVELVGGRKRKHLGPV